MKKLCVLLAACIFGAVHFVPPCLGVQLPAGTSMWAVPVGDCPASFDGMTFFWGLAGWEQGAALDYDVFRPDGATGPIYDHAWPVDLSPFHGSQIVVEFTNEGTGYVCFEDDAYVWDGGIEGGMNGPSGYPVYFAFYQLGPNGWSDRSVVGYVAGQILWTSPAKGDLFFHHELDAYDDWMVQYDYPECSLSMGVRSDFYDTCADEETDCDNGVDDDCDGLTDGSDPDCCIPNDEICTNGLDDDCDGLVDADDPDCKKWQASTVDVPGASDSNALNAIAIVFIPVGVILGLTWRMRK